MTCVCVCVSVCLCVYLMRIFKILYTKNLVVYFFTTAVHFMQSGQLAQSFLLCQHTYVANYFFITSFFFFPAVILCFILFCFCFSFFSFASFLFFVLIICVPLFNDKNNNNGRKISWRIFFFFCFKIFEQIYTYMVLRLVLVCC